MTFQTAAAPIQYSVFAMRDTPGRIGRLAGDIETRVHAKQDDVRIYPVPDHPQLYTIGHQIIEMDGAMLAGDNLLAALAEGGSKRA